MKKVVVLASVLWFGNLIAQEEGHLQGESVTEEYVNDIKTVNEKRVMLAVEVSIYPNPSEGQVFIEGKNGTKITLYSSTGIYVGTWLIGITDKIQISDLPPGTYLCSIIEGETRLTKKLVVL